MQIMTITIYQLNDNYKLLLSIYNAVFRLIIRQIGNYNCNMY